MSQAIDKAINDRVAAIQKIADATKAEQQKMEDLAKLKSWPANASDEDMARMALLLQSDPSVAQQMDQNVVKEFSAAMEKVDTQRMQAISQEAQKIMQMPRVQPGTMAVEILTVAPEGGDTEWSIAATLVQTDENFKVGVPDTVPQDVCLSLYISPRGQGLSAQFNTEAQETKAGTSFAPLVVKYTPDADGQKFVHLGGHVAAGGKVQPITMVHPFTVDNGGGAAAPKGPQAQM